jgi:hypothetical protein
MMPRKIMEETHGEVDQVGLSSRMKTLGVTTKLTTIPIPITADGATIQIKTTLIPTTMDGTKQTKTTLIPITVDGTIQIKTTPIPITADGGITQTRAASIPTITVGETITLIQITADGGITQTRAASIPTVTVGETITPTQIAVEGVTIQTKTAPVPIPTPTTAAGMITPIPQLRIGRAGRHRTTLAIKAGAQPQQTPMTTIRGESRRIQLHGVTCLLLDTL